MLCLSNILTAILVFIIHKYESSRTIFATVSNSTLLNILFPLYSNVACIKTETYDIL